MTEAAGLVGEGIDGAFEVRVERPHDLAGWFQAEYEPLLRFAYIVAGDRHTAEDLVQEAFVRLHRAGARAERHGVGTYARRAIVNLHRTAIRRRFAERRALSCTTSSAPAADPAEWVVDGHVWHALLALSPRQRACIALRFYEGMKEWEIAETLGVSSGAVKKHTDRAMAKLRARLGVEGP